MRRYDLTRAFCIVKHVVWADFGRSGYWWSPEGSKICYTEVDYSDIPLFRIPHYTSENREEEAHNYPFTGERNCTTR